MRNLAASREVQAFRCGELSAKKALLQRLDLKDRYYEFS